MAPKFVPPHLSSEFYLGRFREERQLKDGSLTNGWKRAWNLGLDAREKFKKMRKEFDNREPHVKEPGATQKISKRGKVVTNRRSAHATRVRDLTFVKALGHEVD